jgi:pimeloyl-ACP methyl ester carboxylesterase
MKHHTITGGGGTLLHLVETGNPRGQPILFIHGISQCALAWERQLSSPTLGSHRLIAMDMRGHGSSERPLAGYDDSRRWADDVDAVIRELSLDQPILCGWSYGPLVILDYIRHYGERRIGGIHFTGGITKLGSAEAVSVLTPEVLGLVPGLFSRDAEQSVGGLEGLVRLFFAREPAAAQVYTVLGWNVSVPPFVREAMFSRVLNNDDVLRAIRTPVLITHGTEDAVVRLAAVDQHRANLPHAQIHIMQNAGHVAFLENPEPFNQRLAEFSRAVRQSPAATPA